MSTTRPQLLFAVAVWAVAETVLQIHGLRFWGEHGGWQGWLWSVALGVVAVWFWLHRNPWLRWLLGGIASLLLLLGPLWQVGAPLVAAIEQRATQQGGVALRCELLRNAETNLSATLHTYLRNSEARPGWAPELARVRGELAATRAELATLAAAPPTGRVAWLSLTVIALQLLALFTLQVAAIAALTTIRQARQSAAPYMSPASPASPMSQSAVAPEPPATPAKRNATATPATPPTDTAAIRARIAAGHYGPAPSIRKVMTAENRRYQTVGPIFKDLLAAGVLRPEGRGYRLA